MRYWCSFETYCPSSGGSKVENANGLGEWGGTDVLSDGPRWLSCEMMQSAQKKKPPTIRPCSFPKRKDRCLPYRVSSFLFLSWARTASCRTRIGHLTSVHWTDCTQWRHYTSTARHPAINTSACYVILSSLTKPKQKKKTKPPRRAQREKKHRTWATAETWPKVPGVFPLKS